MKKPEANFGKIQQVRDGQSVRYHRRKNGTAVAYSICCDCGLVHLEEYFPKKSYIRVKAWRDDERTEWRRKNNGSNNRR